MTQRGKYIFWLGCLVWLFILAIAKSPGSIGILESIADIRGDFHGELMDSLRANVDAFRGVKSSVSGSVPFLAATAGWCGASYLLGKIFGGE